MLVNELLNIKYTVRLIFPLFLLVFGILGQRINAQSVQSPSNQLEMVQINGYRYPAPTLGNLLWLALVPNDAFVEEVALFDFMDFEVDGNYCPYFTSGRKLPSAEYALSKCENGQVCLSWKMEHSRISRQSMSVKLKRELSHYSGYKKDEFTTSYKIRYGKWFVNIDLIAWNGIEKLKVWASTDPH
jgi:hypothetical protein